MEAVLKNRPVRAQQRHVIDDGSKVGEVRRAAQTLANFEFDAGAASNVAIAATELANNMLLHAGGGELLVQILGTDDDPAIELLAIDKGRGMEDVARCLRDGYSTVGTPGTGLGAVRRLADEFEIHSVPEEGTVVMARFGPGAQSRVGAVSVAMHGEIDCGDAWHLINDANGTAIIVVDGLGHGTFAHQAAQTCIATFTSTSDQAPVTILQRANLAMSKTRGGAAACARFANGSMTYAGVGNISGHLVSQDKSQGLVSHNGTLGMHKRQMQQFDYPVPPRALLVMHSDGISARWDLRSRLALRNAHPALIAGVLYRDHRREHDDATIVVIAT